MRVTIGGKQLHRIGAALAIVSAAIVAACNLDSSYVSGGGFAGGGTSSNTGTGPTNTPPLTGCEAVIANNRCPPSQSMPTATTCEIGENANPTCNAGLQCRSGRSVPEDAGPTQTCTHQCPAAYTEDLPDACALPTASTTICEYPTGTCGCVPVRAARADAGDAGDAGKDAEAGSETYVWTCVQPEAGCPRERPRIGSACVRPQVCDYGHCLFDDGVRMHCYNSAWSSERCER